jgi:large conductance mechanosensitive channel
LIDGVARIERQRNPGRLAPNRMESRLSLRSSRATMAAARACGPPKAEGTMLEEFKKFAMRGNVVDLAIGVIIGAAFGKIIESLVGDIIMPVIGAVGGLDFSNYFLPLSKSITATSLVEAKKQGAVLAYGNFITVAINFLIIAWALFMAVKGLNRLERKDEVAVPPPPKQEVLLQEIRDILATKA